jgi:hypothetical protein
MNRESSGAKQDPSEEIEWQDPISHPWPIVQELTAESAKTTSRHRLSYIRYLLQTETWKDSQVSAQDASHPKERPRNGKDSKTPVKEAWVKRLDGTSFRLVKEGVLFYVLYEVTGLELIYVQDIYWKSERGRKELWVDFTRVLSTLRASEQCDRDDDLVENVIRGDETVVRTARLGARSLRTLLEQQRGLPSQRSNSRLTFHRGDVLHQTCAHNIVGFVGWSSLTGYPHAVSRDEEIARAHELLSKMCQVAHGGSEEIRNINEIDWVYCGGDFSDRVPDAS